MSLVIWLPLLSNLENYGTSSLTFANSSGSAVATNASGKIGSCYYRASAKSAGRIESNTTITLNGDLSMCCWAKVTATVGDTANGLVTNHSHANNTGFGICVKQVSSTDYRISCNTGNGSGRTYCTYYGTSNIKDGWHHLALTYNNTTHVFELWVDGKVEKTQSYTNSARADKIRLFDWSTTYGGNDYKPACYMNDVRVYNHCLSQAEVHEIAQGLVLHYKLDGLGRGNFGNPNLALGSNTNSTSTNRWGGHSAVGGNTSTIEVDESGTNCVKVTRDATAQSSWDYLSYNNFNRGAIKVNTTYTVSFDCKPSVDGSIGFTGLLNGNATNYMTSSTSTIQGTCKANQWNHMIFQCVTKGSFSDISVSGQVIYFSRSASLRGINTTVLFKNIKLEEGTIDTPWCPADTEQTIDRTTIIDSSGYGHNGAIINALTLETASPRYSACTHISATNQKIQISNFPTSGFGNSYTFSWWEKISSNSPMRWGFSDGVRLNALLNGNLWNTGDGSSNPLYNPGTTTQVTAPTIGVWHHWVMTGNGTKCYVYKDGVLWAEAKTYKSISGSTIYINGWNSGTDYCSNNYSISDFRIYCTALSAADVKQLYEVGAKVDNKQNLHTYEIKETGSNIKLMKTGILIEKELNETTATKFYKSGIIETNNLIEL